MSRADRLERLDAQRLDLEAGFERLLVDALRRAAKGSWGLFAHTSDKWSRKTWEPTVTELGELGDQIDQMRASLSLDPFPLYAEFLASRGPVASNAPGEPKQAKAWLERLGIDD
ncbi:MAG: hypothetical protein ACKOPE_09545 [Novosphingobium sp.]